MRHGENTLNAQGTGVYYGAKGNLELEKLCLRESYQMITLKVRD